MKSTLTIFIFLLITGVSFGQCDDIASTSEANFTNDFISDGQTYRALLVDDQIAEFNTVFFGGTTYRISAATNTQKGIVFNVLDQNRNILYSSADYENAAYWDIKVENTINCIIEAQLDQSIQNSGCAVLLIGFKQ
jgi:hypothetical protein